MQAELRANFPDLEISLLGVNDRASEFGNVSVTEDRDLPWLQDVDANGDLLSDVWELWEVVERDVIILDSNNVMAGRYNLTENDLAEAENYETLLNLFVDIASLENNQTSPSSLSGEVYFDVNNDGLRNNGELAVGNVEISLSGTTSSGEAVQVSQFTEADGSYSFLGLAPGSYTIRQSQPEFLIDGIETVGRAGGTSSDNQFTVTLGEGVDGSGYNFGERGREAAAIGLSSLFATAAKDGMISCAERAGDNFWFTLLGDWNEYQYANVELADTGDRATVQARDTHGHDLEGHFTVTPTLPDSTQMSVVVTNETQSLVRFEGQLTDLTAANDGVDGEAEGEPLPPVDEVAAINLPQDLVTAANVHEATDQLMLNLDWLNDDQDDDVLLVSLPPLVTPSVS